MDQLELLRRAMRSPMASAATHASDFPPHELRFVLEYPTKPDLAAQHHAVQALLCSDAFQLRHLAEHDVLERFLLLRFPGIERTLPRRDLFAMGYSLADALNVVSAEPDLGTDFYADPERKIAGAGVETASMLGGLCRVDVDAPADVLWALKNTRLDLAWEISKGEGIVVAQPDTGVARHDEIDESMLALEQATDILDGDPDPADPLDPTTANPGHGTATASVLGSRIGHIKGAAPLAKVAPIRCINDVKVFDAAPVAAAVSHAVRAGCHVITMSLGGVPSRALHVALRAAVGADLIVLAAAGNCVRTVVWPARYDEVIGVAGTNVDDRPWKGSCRGSAVAVSAPAENVWRAWRSKPSDPTSGVAGGEGTSFAVALVAGAAALWLSHHGRDAVVAQARLRGTSVQRLFRSALTATARRPALWDGEDFGAGILDASALLTLDLAAIPASMHESVGSPHASPVVRLLDEEIAPRPTDRAFPWPMYELELASIALAQVKLGQSVQTLSTEAKVAATRPSPQLSHACAQSSDSRLAAFSERAGRTALSRPPAIPATDADARRLRLAAPRMAGLESAGGVFDPQKAREYFRGSGGREQLERVERILGAETRADPGLRNTLLTEVDQAIGAIGRGDRLSFSARMGLETLVKLVGRPVLRVRGDSVDLKDPRAREWQDRLQLLVLNPDFIDRLKSVGRIDAEGVQLGTGFVVSPGFVLTNRHVLQTFAAPVPRRNHPDHWLITQDDVTIDFAEAPSSATATSRFRIKSVVAAGPSEIAEDEIDFTDMDVALLEVETTNADGQSLPVPTAMLRNPAKAAARTEVFGVGYPARPSTLPRTSNGEIDLEVAKRLNALFGTDYGTKYLAPGEIDRGVGWPGDTQKWTLTHDATTLGGNSGSSVIAFTDPVGVVGLHFGGEWLRENYAHALAGLHRDTNFMTDPRLNWVD